MNLGTLRTLAANFLGDPDQTRFTGKYDAALNRAQDQFALDSRVLFKDQSYTSAADDSTYVLPSDFMWEDKVTFDGRLLQPISRFDLEIEKRGDSWEDDEGTPTHYLVDPEEANKVLRLYPTPQAGDADKTIVLRYFPKPTDMASDSDQPLNSYALLAQFHPGISAYAAWEMLTYEEQTPAIVAKRRELLQIYNDTVTKAVNTFANTISEPIQLQGGRGVIIHP